MSKYRDALLSATLRNDAGDTHEINVCGSVFEIMHVCTVFGLEPDPELGEGGTMFVNSRSGSFGSIRPVDKASDVIDQFMEAHHNGECGGHGHDDLDDLF
jgi:hypothetical protein